MILYSCFISAAHIQLYCTVLNFLVEGGGNNFYATPTYIMCSAFIRLRKVTRSDGVAGVSLLKKGFLEKAVLEPVYKFDKKSYRTCLKR